MNFFAAELGNWYLKERLGLGDYRLQSLKAILRWHTLLFCAYAFLQYRRVESLLKDPQAEVAPLSEVLDAHKRWHAEQTWRRFLRRLRCPFLLVLNVLFSGQRHLASPARYGLCLPLGGLRESTQKGASHD